MKSGIALNTQATPSGGVHHIVFITLPRWNGSPHIFQGHGAVEYYDIMS